jgi:restriction endonuclease S subunit
MNIANKKILENNPLIYSVNLLKEDDRLDCAWFNPIVENKIDFLKKKELKDRKLVKLKLVADISGGKRLPKGTVVQENESNIIPYVRGIDVKNLKINTEKAIKIPKNIHQIIQNYQLKKDDIVITIVGTIGDAGILENDVEVCDFTENVARVRIINDSVISRFLLYYLNSEYGKIQTDRFSVGSLQYKLSLKSCRNIEVYLPITGNRFDLKKQQFILEKVYSVFKEAGLKKEKSLRLIKEARATVHKKIGIPIISFSSDYETYNQVLNVNFSNRLDALFNNPIREKLLNILKRYPNKPLGKLINPQTKGKIIPSDFYRLVDLEQIDENTGRIIEAKEVPELGSKKILLKENSILISKLQPEKGKVALVNQEYDGCVGSSELVSIVLTSSEIILEYLWIILRSDYVLKQWGYELTGSSRMRIGWNEIRDTIIPIPEKKVQKTIVEEVKQKIAISDKAEKESEELLKKTKNEFLRLLVFNGQ